MGTGKLTATVLAAITAATLAAPAFAGADRYYLGRAGNDWLGIQVKQDKIAGSYLRYMEHCRVEGRGVKRKLDMTIFLGGTRLDGDGAFRDDYEKRWGPDLRVESSFAGKVDANRARARFRVLTRIDTGRVKRCRARIEPMTAQRVSRREFVEPVERWFPGIGEKFERAR